MSVLGAVIGLAAFLLVCAPPVVMTIRAERRRAREHAQWQRDYARAAEHMLRSRMIR